MANYVDPKLTVNVTLDDESKELIRQLVRAVDRIADVQAPEERSFADPKTLKRILDGPTSGFIQAGEGDWTLYNNEREGEELE